MLTKTKMRQNGFTIVETLIVLAIVGTIMLVVFLAVPALQRNSRNTQIRNDAASVLSAVNEFITNNNGALPDAVSAGTDGVVTVSRTGPTYVSSTGRIRGGTTVGIATSFNGAATPASPNIAIRTNTACNGNTPVALAGRSFVADFTIETGTSTTPQCVAS